MKIKYLPIIRERRGKKDRMGNHYLETYRIGQQLKILYKKKGKCKLFLLTIFFQILKWIISDFEALLEEINKKNISSLSVMNFATNLL